MAVSGRFGVAVVLYRQRMSCDGRAARPGNALVFKRTCLGGLDLCQIVPSPKGTPFSYCLTFPALTHPSSKAAGDPGHVPGSGLFRPAGLDLAT
jgi:hypothetical protein